MTRLGSAEFREFASVSEAAQSLGWAGTQNGRWMFGVPKLLRNTPVVGNSAVGHELFHAVQDMQYGLFGMNEASMSLGQWFNVEATAHVFGGPFVLPAAGTVIGVGAYGAYRTTNYLVR